MKQVLSFFLFVNLLVISSCTSSPNYQKKADDYIQSKNIQNSIIKTNLFGTQKNIIYTTESGVMLYDLVSDSLTKIISQDDINDWKYFQDSEGSTLLLISDQYVTLWENSFSSETVSFAEQLEGTISQKVSDSNNLFITTSTQERYKISLYNGDYIAIMTIGEYLEENKIRENIIYKIFDDFDRSCLFYKPSGFLFSGDLLCYDATTGKTYTYPDCWSVHGMTDDGTAIVIYSKNDGEYLLNKIDTYTCKSEIIARGSEIKTYQGGYLVKKYDLTEEYYDGNCFRREKPQPQGILSGLFDALFN